MCPSWANFNKDLNISFTSPSTFGTPPQQFPIPSSPSEQLEVDIPHYSPVDIIRRWCFSWFPSYSVAQKNPRNTSFAARAEGIACDTGSCWAEIGTNRGLHKAAESADTEAVREGIELWKNLSPAREVPSPRPLHKVDTRYRTHS